MPPPSPSNPMGALPKGINNRTAFAYPLSFTTAAGADLAANGGTRTLNVTGIPGQVFRFLNIGFASDGPFLIQLIMTRLGGGLFNEAVSSETLLGPLDRPGLMAWPIEVIGSEAIQVQLTNDNGAVLNQVKLTFWGMRDYLGQC
jgi:hypothetical protein